MYRANKILVFLIAIAVFTGCEIDSPIKELSTAKSAITLARTYKADIYAKDILAEAEKALYDAHTLVKDGKNTDAAAKAVVSKTKADEALVQALPLYVQATIDQAKSDITTARDSYADEFAPDDMTKADGLVAEAEALQTAKSYIPANDKALAASIAAKSALDKTYAQAPLVQGKIAEVESDRDGLVSQKADQYAADDMKSLNDKIAEAKDNLTQKKIKESLYSVSEAKELIETIRTAGIASAIQQKIAKADEGIATISKSPDASRVTVELDSAKAKVQNAKDQIDEKKYSEASASADEALAIIDAIVLSLERFAVEAKAAADAKTAVQPEQPKDTTPKTVEEKIREYIVQWRKVNTDCLWRIADKVYKDAKLWPLIFMANRTQIKDPDLIYPGQKLVIPPVPTKPEKKPADVTDNSSQKTADKNTQPVDQKTDAGKGDAAKTPDAIQSPDAAKQPEAKTPESDKPAQKTKPAGSN